MKRVVIDKETGGRRQVDEGQPLRSDRPSIFLLKIAPEKVSRYERRADDLVLVLKNGQELVILGFFIKYADTSDATPIADGQVSVLDSDRNELVLEDDNGVVWWGQYPEDWSEFYFTEIEFGDDSGFAWWPLLLGALVGGVGAVAFAGSSDSGPDGGAGNQNTPPVANDDAATTN